MKRAFGNLTGLLLFFSLFFSGCATTAQRRSGMPASVNNYLSLDEFCKKYNFEYSFDTLDDVISLNSPDKEMKLLLNSTVVLYNGSAVFLKVEPLYYNGRILLPPQLVELVSRGPLASFKPTFNFKTIVIDPGHGGKDPGAISCNGLQEKKINLIVAGYLKEDLERQGFKVIMTRTSDSYLTLAQRTNIAKKYHADLFVSIHANSNRSSSVQGCEIYYLSPSRLNSLERALKLAKSESFRSKKLDSDTETILWDLLIARNHALSSEISNMLYFTFKNLGFSVKPPKQAPFYVLRFAYVPAVLVEMGYLSNSYEEKALRKKYYQKQVAQAIALGIVSLNKHYAELPKK
ncbi:MAG: N-acetylmuramoyl-L-alanine amidase [Candidatus Omnitrophica bacterium]|nr:N-acetylmuramoyl-L-alanine amidase [Candidatus Omnitrophota bacterium]MBU2045081.1 N-acetylmuramoyl-L-alanine amidase [Candidatus Omnitrophota bacterium]MBU2251753.1 N-acetylmuramoyl-L-alanine amidase [Candidatus Omnitrophota bacterium]MBU2473182.1 N-acetylmuramoyl-L-alanine amidase [Candidatus Omnitrophota bacterium]